LFRRCVIGAAQADRFPTDFRPICVAWLSDFCVTWRIGGHEPPRTALPARFGRDVGAQSRRHLPERIEHSLQVGTDGGGMVLGQGRVKGSLT
jgi:hypothetical protein